MADLLYSVLYNVLPGILFWDFVMKRRVKDNSKKFGLLQNTHFSNATNPPNPTFHPLTKPRLCFFFFFFFKLPYFYEKWLSPGLFFQSYEKCHNFILYFHSQYTQCTLKTCDNGNQLGPNILNNVHIEDWIKNTFTAKT